MALYRWSTKLAGIWAWFNPTNLWTNGQVLTRNSNWYGYADAPVTSVNSQTWAVTINAVPSWWTDWQVLSKVSGSVAWANPSWWIENVTTWTTTTVTGIWAWSEAEYNALSTKSASVLYITFEWSWGGKTLLTYDELVALWTNSWHTAVATELNTAPLEYYNMLNGWGYLQWNTLIFVVWWTSQWFTYDSWTNSRTDIT
jgi:hypothetical protein